MPELATTQGYGIQGVKYDPRAFNYGPAPELTVDNSGAIGILGNAQSLGIVSDTLSKLPTVIQDAYKKGQLRTEQNIAHQLKLGALAGGLTDSMKIGADDSVTLNPEDPETAALKQQAIQANIAYRNAMAKKASATPAVTGPFDDSDLPGETTPPPSASPALARPTGNVDALGNPVTVLPPGSPKAGPLSAPTDFNQTPDMPDGTGALGQAFVDGAAAPVGATTPVGALAAAQEPEDAPPIDVLPPLGDLPAQSQDTKGLTWKNGNKNTPAEGYDKDGNLAAVWVYGAKAPHFLPRPVAPKPTDEEAATRAAKIATARTEATVKVKAENPTEVKIPAAIETEMIESGYNPRGKNPKDAIEEFTQARIASGTIPKYLIGPTQRVMAQAENSKQVKDYSIAMGAQSAIHAAMSGDQNGLTDMALIEGVQRTLNPNATVRVGNIQQMKDAAGWLATKDPDFLWKQAVQGDKLTPEARQRAIKVAQDAFAQLKKEAEPRLREMKDTLQTYGVSEKSAQALLDSQLKGLGLAQPAPPAKPAGAIHVKFPDGRTGWVPNEEAFGKAAAENPGLIKF